MKRPVRKMRKNILAAYSRDKLIGILGEDYSIKSVKTMSEFETTVVTESSNSYGVHLLVDFRPIDEACRLLVDCRKYIEDTQSEMFVVPFAPSFSRIVKNVRQWRMKRKYSNLQTTYDALAPRIIACERDLRQIIGDVVEKKTALRLQARHLQIRLEACLKHNKNILLMTDQPLGEARLFVDTLSGEMTYVKQILTFNAEILRLKDSEENTRKQAALRWGGMSKHNRNNNNNNNNGNNSNGLKGGANNKNGSKDKLAELLKDEDQKMAEERLRKYREIREKFVNCLTSLLERRSGQQLHVDNCTMSLDALKAVVRREGLNDSNNSNNGHNNSSTYHINGIYSPTPSSPIIASSSFSSAAVDDRSGGGSNNYSGSDDGSLRFDHARCTDCSYGFSMASDCINHLAALQKQALNANERLQELVEVRERMLEASEAFRLSQAAEDGVNRESSNRESSGGGQQLQGMELKES